MVAPHLTWPYGHTTPFEMIPTFPTADLDATVSFWSQLGFGLDHQEDDSLGMRHPNGIEFHFWLDTSRVPLRSDVSAYLRFASASEARALYDDWVAVLPPAGKMTEPEDTGYGVLEWYFFDPYRNLIRVGGRL